MTTAQAASASLLQIASFLGASGVGLGAVGAHAFQQTLLARNSLKSYQTAVLYHLLHAVAIVGVSAHVKTSKDSDETKMLVKAGQAMGLGSVLFSGSIYFLSFGIGPKKILGPTTPLGGLLMISGWVMLGFSGRK